VCEGASDAGIRRYLKGKGWLDTFESAGPHTPGFNPDFNAKIYNKLIILCGKGYALTYAQNAAEFVGVGDGRQLLAHYDGFSRQRNRSLRKTFERLKHTSGTSMSDHIDLFEKICGQIASSGLPATEEEKLDWFLESVHEDTYHAIKAHCCRRVYRVRVVFESFGLGFFVVVAVLLAVKFVYRCLRYIVDCSMSFYVPSFLPLYCLELRLKAMRRLRMCAGWSRF
jgi:hypothetical protein